MNRSQIPSGEVSGKVFFGKVSFRLSVFSAKCLFGNVGKKSQEKSHGKQVIDLGRKKELMSKKKKVTEMYHWVFSMNLIIFTNNTFINIFCLG